jgi:hypothetical protein
MPTALVTGPVDERLSEMSIALKSAGFDVVTAAADAYPMAGEVSSVDCYVQLPNEPPPHRGDALGWAREVLGQTLLARFDLAAQVAPMLLPQAKVVLVRNRAAPRALSIDAGMLRVLTMAILADHDRDGVRVAVVGDSCPPAEIVRFANSEAPAWSEYADMAPDLGFATGNKRSPACSRPTTTRTARSRPTLSHQK